MTIGRKGKENTEEELEAMAGEDGVVGCGREDDDDGGLEVFLSGKNQPPNPIDHRIFLVTFIFI